MEKDTVISIQKIRKSFPGVLALDNVDFTLRKGEIHALMGENGAGKSTLIKVLTGVYHKDSGQIYISGIDKPVTIKSPQEAQNMGISTVYQEITLCPNLTVAENMFIGRGKYNFVNWNVMEKKSKRYSTTSAFPPNQTGSFPLIPLPYSRWSPSRAPWIWSAKSLYWTNRHLRWTTRKSPNCFR